MSEDYVRPPIVALEAPNHRAGTWRFRIIWILILAALAVGIVLIAKSVVGNGEGDGGSIGTLSHLHALL